MLVSSMMEVILSGAQVDVNKSVQAYHKLSTILTKAVHGVHICDEKEELSEGVC
jgi:hypothetical protein